MEIILYASWTQKRVDVSLLKYRWDEVEHQFLGAKHLSRESFTLVLLDYENSQFYCLPAQSVLRKQIRYWTNVVLGVTSLRLQLASVTC